MKMYFKMT